LSFEPFLEDWSWSKARASYYDALTINDNDTREQELANTFRSLGQVMHLVSDSSVPAHTRNDIHVFPFTEPIFGITFGEHTYESWTAFEDVSHTYTAEGVYYPTVTVTDSEGNTYSDTIAITVLSRDEMDALLKGKWGDMKAALAEGDIEGALQYIIAGNRDRLRAEFIALGAELAAIMASVEGCEIYSLYEDLAFGGLLRTENGTVYSYPITFMTDKNGIWKIRGF
jgi:hypothetical protein